METIFSNGKVDGWLPTSLCEAEIAEISLPAEGKPAATGWSLEILKLKAPCVSEDKMQELSEFDIRDKWTSGSPPQPVQKGIWSSLPSNSEILESGLSDTAEGGSQSPVKKERLRGF